MKQFSRKRVDHAMIEVCTAAKREHCDQGWMHSFQSVAATDNANNDSGLFSILRTLNEDWIEPGQSIPEHRHQNVEIISYVLEGTLEHRDSMGNETVVRPGDLQLVGAGTGVVHSEANGSPSDVLHYLRICLDPQASDLEPYYEQRHFQQIDRDDRIFLLASPDGRAGSVTVRQDACLYNVVLNAGEVLRQNVPEGRRAYLHVARGTVLINDRPLQSGDGAGISAEAELTLTTPTRGEALLFDLP